MNNRSPRNAAPGPGVGSGASGSLPMWSRRAVRVMGVLLVLVGMVAAWQTSSFARHTWWEQEPREAVRPDEQGVAQANGLRVAVDQVGIVESAPTWDEDVEPLDGHRFWHISLRMDIEDSDVRSCEIYVDDTQGRRYEVSRMAPSGVEGYSGYPQCSVADSDREVEPVQAFLVVIPDDAQPQVIRVHSQFSLGSQYLELPAG